MACLLLEERPQVGCSYHSPVFLGPRRLAMVRIKPADVSPYFSPGVLRVPLGRPATTQRSRHTAARIPQGSSVPADSEADSRRTAQAKKNVMMTFTSSVCRVGIRLFHLFVRQRIVAELPAAGVDVLRPAPQKQERSPSATTRPADGRSVSRSMARGVAYAPSFDSSSDHFPVVGVL